MGSVVPTLLEIQTAVRHGILGNGDATVAATLGNVLLPAERLSIYYNTSRTALTNALRLNFPAVQRLVGDDFFAAAADTFITHEPPQTAWLDLYGEGFPEFLQSFEPAAALIYLPDVARLERAVNRAFHTVDAGPLEYSRLLDMDPSIQVCVCFVVHPSVSLVSSSYPVDTIWRSVLAQDDAALAAINLSSGHVHLLIERRSGEIEVTRLDELRWKFAEALFAGNPLGVALEAVEGRDGTGWLAEHIATRRLAGFKLSYMAHGPIGAGVEQ